MQRKGNNKMKYQEPDMEVILIDDTLLTLVEVSSTEGVDKPVNGMEIDI